MAKKKLPRVWVEFWENGRPRQVYEYKIKPAWGGNAVHQYAPVEPKKVCVWKPDPMGWETGCERMPTLTVTKPKSFCQFCGGRIKVKEKR